MAAARRPARKKPARKKSAKSSALGGKVLGLVVTLVAIGGLLAFMSINHITSVQGGIDYFKNMSNQTSDKVRNSGLDDDLNHICNFVDDPSCLYGGNAQAKIGDLNGDGTVNDSDSDLYAKEHGINEGKSSTTGSSKLDQLTVADASSDKYKASEWPHWVIVSGTCDAREQALKNAGFKTDSNCRPTSGSYSDPYSGEKITDPDSAVISYKIPIGYVEQHGGAAWSKDQKQAYANDSSNLVVTSKDSNDKRGDRGPFSWAPRAEYKCAYANDWVDTALKYKVSVTQRDKTELADMLKTCSQ
jgi:hypothetical protein